MNAITDYQISLNLDDILRGQGGDPELIRQRKPVLVLAAERALIEGSGLIHPIALTCEFVVQAHRHERILLEGGSMLTGPTVADHLSGSQRVIAVICTIGAKLEEAVSHLLGEDPLLALALDGLGNAAVENLSQQICAKIAKQVLEEGLQASTPLSPGSLEWPVEVGQPEIFTLLDPSKAGIRLTSGGMMLPKKSMSFIVGIGPEMSQTGMCDVCSLKATCRYGHA
jgi:hypothetical protein